MSRLRPILALLVLLLLAGGWLALHRLQRVERPREAVVEETETEEVPPVSLAPVESVPAAREHVEVTAARVAPDDVATVPLAADEARLRIHVVAKETGAGLPGISVVLRPPGGSYSYRPEGTSSRGQFGETLLTDEHGWVEYIAPAGQGFGLMVNTEPRNEAGRDNQEVAPLAAGERREHVVELPTAFDLAWFGRVVDGQSGVPLAGANVERIAGDPFDEHTGEPTALSAANGLAQLAFASWVTSYARVEHPGYAAGFVQLDSRHERASAACEVPMFRAGAIEALVTDAMATSQPGVRLVVSCEAREWIQGTEWISSSVKAPPWEAETDGDGRCSVEGLPANVALRIELFSGDRLLRRDEHALRLEPGERRALACAVGFGCTVQGRTLEADGRAAPGVEVWLRSEEGGRYFERYGGVVRKARSDENGLFILESVAVGSWMVGPAPGEGEDAGTIAPVATTLVIAPEDTTIELALTCWRGLYIRGTVVGPGGESVDGAFVAASGEGIADFDTSRRGSFSLGPLPSGSFEVTASNLGEALADSETVTVPAGTEGLVLAMGGGGSVAVTVVDSRGNPATGVMVWVINEAMPDEGAIATDTDEHGVVEFDGRPPGSYTVSASTAAGEFAMERDVVVGSEGDRAEVELRLEPAARLRIRVLPGIEQGTTATLWKDGRLIAPFPFRQDPLAVVPPGEIEVELLRWTGKEFEPLQRRKVFAVLGQETAVDFDLTSRPK